jgi:hypothetical protein
MPLQVALTYMKLNLRGRRCGKNKNIYHFNLMIRYRNASDFNTRSLVLTYNIFIFRAKENYLYLQNKRCLDNNIIPWWNKKEANYQSYDWDFANTLEVNWLENWQITGPFNTMTNLHSLCTMMNFALTDVLLYNILRVSKIHILATVNITKWCPWQHFECQVLK